MSCFSDNNLKMKVLTSAKVKIRLMQKSIFGKSRDGRLLQKSSGEGRSTELFWARFWFWLLQKMAKARTFFWKSPEKFCKKSRSKSKIGVSLRIPSNSYWRFWVTSFMTPSLCCCCITTLLCCCCLTTNLLCCCSTTIKYVRINVKLR